MVRLIILLIIYTLFLSCNTPETNTPIYPALPKADNFAMKFIDKHPNAWTNDITIDNTSNEFSRSVKSFVSDSMGLSDMPLVAVGMRQIDGKVMVHFQRNDIELTNAKYLLNISIDVFAIMDSDQTVNITQSSSVWYCIPSYSKVVSIDGPPFPYKVSDRIYTEYPGISKPGLDRSVYSFGNYILMANKVINYPYQSRYY